MARMYSGSKGKSGSKKPLSRVPSWAPYKEKEVEKLVIKYSKAGKSSSEIGARPLCTRPFSTVARATPLRGLVLRTRQVLARGPCRLLG